MKIRPFWVLVHRYAGLAMTVFLILVGVTGSLLAFYSELDGAVNPHFEAEAENRPPLDFVTLYSRAERLAPQARINSIRVDAGSARVMVSPKKDPHTGKPYELGFDELFLNPHTGEELGRRTWGEISQGFTNLMPFIYKLHYSLAIGDVGTWVLGITALIWTLDCFVGFYLTLPPAKRKQSSTPPTSTRSFWQRWRPAWLIKWGGSNYRVNFDLHRAGGLWLWAMLLIFAWSSVYMNLGNTVYKTVMQTVSEIHEPWIDFADLEQPLENPRITWREACRIGQQAIAIAAKQHNFRVETPAPVAMWLNRGKGFYVYNVRSSADIQDKYSRTRAIIDATTGDIKQLLLPTGQYSGTTITTWLSALHTADVFGLPYKIFVSIFGLVIVMLSVTGVVIWLKKRRARALKCSSDDQSG